MEISNDGPKSANYKETQKIDKKVAETEKKVAVIKELQATGSIKSPEHAKLSIEGAADNKAIGGLFLGLGAFMTALGVAAAPFSMGTTAFLALPGLVCLILGIVLLVKSSHNAIYHSEERLLGDKSKSERSQPLPKQTDWSEDEIKKLTNDFSLAKLEALLKAAKRIDKKNATKE